MKRYLIVLACAWLLWPVLVDADGGDPDVIHVCMMRSGTPRFVPPKGRCRLTETPVHWARSTLEASAAVHVVDSRGVVVGPMVGERAEGAERRNYVAAFRLGGLTLPVLVGRDRIVGGSYNVLVYAGDDCTGQPAFRREAIDYSPGPVTAIAAPRMTLYMADPDETAYRVAPIRSTLSLNNGDCTTRDSGVLVWLAPAIPIMELDGLFVPPFNLR